MMNTIIIELKTLTPLLLSAPSGGDENSSRSLDYIPGSVLRGAMVARYKNPGRSDLQKDSTARKLFFDGSTSYLNAYPCKEGGERSLPIPVSWYKPKDDDSQFNKTAGDLALGADAEIMINPMERGYCLIDNEGTSVFTNKPDLSIHITGEERGRTGKGTNTVFQYQALPKDQYYKAGIQFSDKDSGKRILELLQKDEHLFLGASRSAGYGWVKIIDNKEAQGEGDDDQKDLEELTTITFLSDGLLRNKYGQPTLSLDEALYAELGIDVENIRAYVNPAINGGFNRTWRLPLPQHRGVGMGSVFVYRSDELDLDQISTIIESGIGERCIDGYGRIAINWPGQKEIIYTEYETDTGDISGTTLSFASKSLAQSMAGRLLEQQIQAQLLIAVQRIHISGSIPNHQLGRIRGVIHKALYDPDRQTTPVLKFIDSLSENALKHLKRPRVQPGNERLLSWITSQLKEPDVLQKYVLGSRIGVKQIAGQDPQINDRLQREATLQFIEAVIYQKMIQNRDGGGK